MKEPPGGRFRLDPRGSFRGAEALLHAVPVASIVKTGRVSDRAHRECRSTTVAATLAYTAPGLSGRGATSAPPDQAFI